MSAYSLPMISGSVRHINELLSKLVGGRKEAVFSDPFLRHEVF